MTWKQTIIKPKALGESSMDKGLREESENVREAKRSWASTASHCPRKDVFGQHVETYETDAISELYYALGNAVEDVITRGWYQDGTLLFHGFRLPEFQLNMGGEVDAITLMDGKIWAYEIKSCGKLPSKPKARHQSQALLYSAVTGLPGRIIYQSRSVASYANGGRPSILRREFELPFNLPILRQHVYRAAMSHVFGQLEITPPIPQGMRKTVDCRYCDFIPVCWKGEPTPLPEPTKVESQQLQADALNLTMEIMEEMPQRRSGILKFLSNHGTEHAARMLKGTDWKQYITEPAEDDNS